MTIGLLVSLAFSLATPSSYRDRSPIHSLDEVPLGRYVALGTPPREVVLLRRGDELLLRGDGSDVRLHLRPDGGLAVPGHHGAWILRRGRRVDLAVLYCYRFRVYRFSAPPVRPS
jgi:hypothetical protein